MVRRWSYLNNLNSINSQKISANYDHNTLLLKIFQQTTFKATTYYRKPLYNPLITKITRKNFYRRRHLNNWLVYQNILTLWAREYLFFRKYSRTMLSLFFYKSNFLVYNTLIHSKASIDNLRGYENTHTTHLVKAVKFYFTTNSSSLFPFVKSFKNFSITWLSTPRVNIFLNPKVSTSWEPLYSITGNSLTAKVKNPINELLVSAVFNLNYQQQLNYQVALYKIFIYLTWALFYKK